MMNFFKTFKARWNIYMEYCPVFAALDVSMCVCAFIGLLYYFTN